jgi:glutamine synthetase
MFDGDGAPYMGDPRHILMQVVSRFKAAGWRPVVAAELEFSLVTWDRDIPAHTCPSPVGSGPVGGNTYGLDVLNHHRQMMEDLRVACEIQDLPFDGVVKESAPSQYEINMQHVDDPVKAARQIIMMKRLIKGVAAKHGLIASFMAKPFENEAGNGMHVHCSVLNEKGINIFDDGTDKGTPLLHQAIGGCLTYMAESVAIFAPTYNAYRRFQKGCHAPTFPSWGYENRTVAIRVPASSPISRRLEHRVAGADANPYLLFAAIYRECWRGLMKTCRREAPSPEMATHRKRRACRYTCPTLCACSRSPISSAMHWAARCSASLR